MTDKKIIMEDSPEAASIKTVTGWVSSTGRFWGDDERMARFDGSTHKRCDCGAVIAHRSYCRACSDRKEAEKWEAMPEAEWDGVAMLKLSFLDSLNLADTTLSPWLS